MDNSKISNLDSHIYLKNITTFLDTNKEIFQFKILLDPVFLSHLVTIFIKIEFEIW
jgi:hypothetical protein